MLGMMTAKPFRDEHFYQVPNQFRVGVAEKSFGSRIDRRDTAVDGRDNDRIRGCQEKLPEQRLRVFSSVRVVQVCSHFVRSLLDTPRRKH